MSLYYSTFLGKKGCLGLWKLQELSTELENKIAALHLERSRMPRHETRRREFIAGRLLLVQLLKQMQEPCHGIASTGAGAPYLLNSTYSCSISHDGDYAAAIVYKDEASGIDIAEIDTQVLRVREKFLSTEEQLNCHDERQATLYWAAKETAYKHTKGAVKDFKSIRIVGPSKVEQSGQLGVKMPKPCNFELRMGYFFFESYVVTFSPLASSVGPVSGPTISL